ncbi:Sesquipedalian-1, partial [Chaetura pelagica]
MKLNERSVAHYATCDSPADHAGFLRKRVERHHPHGHHPTSYQRRWFVLKGNLLFYFEERESREPVGKRHLSNPALVPLQEKPTPLENGYSTWGSGGGIPGVATCPDPDGGHAKPPPLPPRRRSAAGSAAGSSAPGLSPAGLESPVSLETACFSKLHSWYGQEIAVLRQEWQERQKMGH